MSGEYVKVLVINCGSSSIKYQLFDADSEAVLARGQVSRIGEGSSSLRQELGRVKLQEDISVPDHRSAFKLIIRSLLDSKNGAIKDVSEISAVGHRAVHGGDYFVDSVIINEDVIARMESCIPLAPLHNPPNLMGIREAREIFPGIPHVAVFDTAFHQTLPVKAYLYALPYEYYEKHKVRRYGFHGTSHRYVSQRAVVVLNQSPDNLRMIICHLGSGVSITAINGGKSVDTSLGFTPIPGVMMGTRSGDIDPGLIFYLNRQLGLSLDIIDNILNRESGLLGISGVSNDMREIMENAQKGNKRCQLAQEMFVYQVKKYVGAYAAAMGGMDVLVFTAGMGENSPLIRRMICADMEFLGINLDKKKNDEIIAVEQIVSTVDSRVKVLVIPTNEELMIARDTIALAFPTLKNERTKPAQL